MKITLTTDQIAILFFLVIMTYGAGWLVVNKLIPWIIVSRARRRKEKQRREHDNS